MAKGPFILSMALGVGITMASMPAMAGEDAQLVIDGREFVTKNRSASASQGQP